MKKLWESAKIAIFFTDEADVIRTSVGGGGSVKRGRRHF